MTLRTLGTRVHAQCARGVRVGVNAMSIPAQRDAMALLRPASHPLHPRGPRVCHTRRSADPAPPAPPHSALRLPLIHL